MANHEATSPDEDLIISTAVAIDRDKNSQHAVRCAVDHLRARDNGIALLHVCTPPCSDPHDDEGPDQDQLFSPYRSLCARKGIQAKEVILYNNDVAGALCEYISANSIRTVILGASTRGTIARAFKAADIPNSVGKSVPDSCSVYTINGKGKTTVIKSASGCDTLIKSRRAFFPDNSSGLLSSNSQCRRWTAAWEVVIADAATEPRQSLDGNAGEESRVSQQMTTTGMPSVSDMSSPLHSLSSCESSNTFGWEKHQGMKNPKPNTCFDSSSVGSQCHSPQKSEHSDCESGHTTPTKRVPTGRRNALLRSAQYPNLRGRNLDSLVSLLSESRDASEAQSFQSDNISDEYLDQTQGLDSSLSSTSLQATASEEDLKRMKLELMQITGKQAAACQEAVTARKMVREIDQLKSEDARKIEEAKCIQEIALAMVEREQQKFKAAMEMAQKAQRLAEMESEKRKHAELMFKHESEEKQMVMDALARCRRPQYRSYTIKEIQAATDNFSSSNKIGEGAFGPVYKATLDHTHVAVKVLSSDASEGQKQFQQEVEVLSQMRHPNIVILLGTCLEHSCLIYEYMDNGSLEDRLFCKNGTPPLPWRVRFQIAAEIATALNFLHQTKPQPLVHRDLKPDNILLDKNYTSKISDVGLSRLVPSSVADAVSVYCMTAAVGTFCYIDPEYQQTGLLGTKSDVYSLGVILLQIITAKPPIGLTHNVESAIEAGRFEEVLDQSVEDWPVDEALSLAKLALQCCELRRKDRPDLDSVILPVLERLRDLG